VSFRLIIVAAIIAMLGFADTSGSPGTLVFSTYLREGFAPVAIATDATGNVYLAGNVVLDAITNRRGVLVEKLNPQGTQRIYLPYLAGSGSDSAGAIAVDTKGSAYIVGTATSPDFPVTTGAAPGNASTDPRRSFLTKLDSNGEVVFSTLLGGSVPSRAQAVALTPQGQILVSGTANGSGFPGTTGAYSVPDSGGGHPFLWNW
jgi:hypothetical protein